MGRLLPWKPIASLSSDRATNKQPEQCASATRARNARQLPRNVSHMRIDFTGRLLLSTLRGLIYPSRFRSDSELFRPWKRDVFRVLDRQHFWVIVSSL
jgi:hypothetical protein